MNIVHERTGFAVKRDLAGSAWLLGALSLTWALIHTAEWGFHWVCFSSLSSQTLGLLRRCGKSNSTIITSETTASGEAPSQSLSMNASPTRHAVSCGWTRNPSSEDTSFWRCWTISRNLLLDKSAQALDKAHQPWLFPTWHRWPTSPDYWESVTPLWCSIPDMKDGDVPPQKYSSLCSVLVFLHPTCPVILSSTVTGAQWNWQTYPVLEASTESLWCCVSEMSNSPFFLFIVELKKTKQCAWVLPCVIW
jgi:hypothetical protein